jgi:TPR repeat protein
MALCAVGAYAVWNRTAAAGKATDVSVAPAQNSPITPPLQAQQHPKEEPKPSPPTTEEAQSPSQPVETQSNSNDSGSAADQRSTSEETAPAANGNQELVEAKRYLEGKGVPKSSTAAAVLLWKSVAKQNPQAVLLLSDLYARGDGVPQSCDQARLLLSAAAKRGSTEAGERLAILQSGGCE